MKHITSHWAFVIPVFVVAAVLVGGLNSSAAKPESKKEDRAVERTRKQVRMLDDLYKTVVVLITEHYVTEESDLPAGSAAKALFSAMKAKGWHDVRLLDATGEPIEDTNSPTKGFERDAVGKLKSGKTWVEQIVKKDGKRYLRAATPIPVVSDKCIMCHDNYAEAKEKGQIIGALGYTIEIE